MISFSLAHDDIEAAARPSANEADWDHRYGGDQMWSGNPNGTLVNEIDGLAAGRALDVGAGEGGDAIWLAEQGWHVTASDISQRALDRVAAEARAARPADRVPPRRRQRARRVRTPERSTSCRRSTRRSPARPTAAASATCSTRSLPAARCSSWATTSSRCGRRSTRSAHSRPFDPDAYVRVDDFVAALADSPEWEIEVHEKRPRPPGPPPPRTTSTTSCCAPDAAPADEALTSASTGAENAVGALTWWFAAKKKKKKKKKQRKDCPVDLMAALIEHGTPVSQLRTRTVAVTLCGELAPPANGSVGAGGSP